MITLESLKELAVKLGCGTCTSDNVADAIKFIADNAQLGSTDLKTLDISFSEVTPEEWVQSVDGMYYLDGATYESLGLDDVTPLALTTIDWGGISNSFAPYMASYGVGLTCSTNMSVGLIKVRLLYKEN